MNYGFGHFIHQQTFVQPVHCVLSVGSTEIEI